MALHFLLLNTYSYIQLETRCPTIDIAFPCVPAPLEFLGLYPLSVMAASDSHVPLPLNPWPPACIFIPTTASLHSVLIYPVSFPVFTSFILPKSTYTSLPIELTLLEGLGWWHSRSNHLNDSTRSASLVSWRISHRLCLLRPGFASVFLHFSYQDFSLFLNFNFLWMFEVVHFLLSTPHKF